MSDDDAIAEAREILGGDEMATLRKYTAKAVYRVGEDYGVDVDETAVDHVVRFVCEKIADGHHSDDTPEHFAERVVTEMVAGSTPARTNVMAAIGALGDEHDDLREIQTAIVARVRRRRGDSE